MRHHYMKIALPLSILLLARGAVAAHADSCEYNLDVYQRAG